MGLPWWATRPSSRGGVLLETLCGNMGLSCPIYKSSAGSWSFEDVCWAHEQLWAERMAQEMTRNMGEHEPECWTHGLRGEVETCICDELRTAYKRGAESMRRRAIAVIEPGYYPDSSAGIPYIKALPLDEKSGAKPKKGGMNE